jgi:hypothetical protein
MFPLFSGPGNVRIPYGDKEWNKRETLETKAFPIRDGNHAPLRLCNPSREKHWKNREKQRPDSANNLTRHTPEKCDPVV